VILESGERTVRPSMMAGPASAAFVAAVCGLALWSQMPPRALPADSPADVFSAERAMRHVEAIAQEPHPLGSPAAARVRAYLMAELASLGLEPGIEQPRDAPAAEHPPAPGPPPARSRAQVQNVVARRRGSGPPGKKALLLSAHHDSVAEAPGAGDDAAGVAAILESLRALEAGGPLERDVIVVMSDGEEAGLYGAGVFADEHPWAKDVGVVLNFDARGNSGPVYMFETSAQNGWLIEQFARSVPHPQATSLAESIYRLMPNSSDFTVFKDRGMAGLNFACIGGVRFYHSPEDTPANLDRQTLQHYGESLLGLARRLGRMDLEQARSPDVVYFSVLSRFVVIYPMAWVMPLCALAGVAFLGVTALGLARRRVRIADLVAGLLLSITALVAAVLAVGVLWLVVRDIAGNLGFYQLLVRFETAVLAAFAVVALVVAMAVVAAASGRWSWEGLGLGALSLWLALTVATSLWLPGASCAYIWPLLAILAGQAAAFAAARGGWFALLAAWLGSVPLLILQTTLLPGLFDALGLRVPALLMVPVALTGLALIPLAGQVMARN
jgi:Peptidase family M28